MPTHFFQKLQVEYDTEAMKIRRSVVEVDMQLVKVPQTYLKQK
jgi:hypothetical protein